MKSKHIATGAVKAGEIRASAVGGPALADGSVAGPELADGSVGGPEVVNGSLGAVEFAADAVGDAAVPDLTFTSLVPFLDSDYGPVGGGNPPEIAKDVQGVVDLRGDVEDAGLDDDQVFTLPPQFRPPHAVTLQAMTFNGESVLINMTPDGVATAGPEVDCTGCNGVNNHRSLLILDPISFVAG